MQTTDLGAWKWGPRQVIEAVCCSQVIGGRGKLKLDAPLDTPGFIRPSIEHQVCGRRLFSHVHH